MVLEVAVEVAGGWPDVAELEGEAVNLDRSELWYRRMTAWAPTPPRFRIVEDTTVVFAWSTWVIGARVTVPKMLLAQPRVDCQVKWSGSRAPWQEYVPALHAPC